MKSKLTTYFSLTVAILLSGYQDLFAADDSQKNLVNIMFIILGLLILFIFGMLVFYDEKSHTAVKSKAESPFWIWFKSLFMTIKSVDDDPLIGHEYDGIKELDHKIPPLLNYIFIFTLVFSVIYILHYHVFKTGDLPSQEYAKEVMLADLQRQQLILSGAMISEETAELTTDAESLQRGKNLFDKNCVTCHGAQGEGLVGPNLTDDYWIHGGSIREIFRVVSEGVPEKGMISWKAQMNPRQIQDLSSYVYMLHGTIEGGKEPEGELYNRNGNDIIQGNGNNTDTTDQNQ